MQLSLVSYNDHNINDGTAFVGSLAPEYPELAVQNVTTTPRSENWPVYAGKVIQGKQSIPILVKCLGTIHDQLNTLKGWFDTFDQNEHPLVVKDSADGDKEWYIDATPVSMPEISGGLAHIVLAAADPVWRSVVENSGTIPVGTAAASGTFAATGNCNSFPVIEIIPRAAKTGTWAYKRSITVVNNVKTALGDYPVNIAGTAPFDTSTLVSAEKMQPDGDDLRIWDANGNNIPRWLYGINSGTTNVWCNLTIPKSGTLTATMLYGSTAFAAPAQDDDYAPVFELNSSNSSWIYEYWKDIDEKRTGRWEDVLVATRGKQSAPYTSAGGDDESPADVMGMSVEAWQKRNKWTAEDADMMWTLRQPLGITHVNFTYATYRAANNFPAFKFQTSKDPRSGKFAYKAKITIPTPGAAAIWGTATSGPVDLNGTFHYARFRFDGGVNATAYNMARAEVHSGTLTIANQPTVTLGAEQDNYQLKATITNVTTGESLTITGVCGLDKALRIDTDAKTVTFDGTTNYLPGLALSSIRNEWLKMAPGENVITFEEAGSTGLDVVVKWRDRNN